MKVRALLKNYRVSPRKVRLVTDMIKGLPVDRALVQLDATLKGSGVQIRKLVESAIANAQNNFNMDRSGLYVEDILVGEGYRLKRWTPRAYGRASSIVKRTSRITIVLSGKEGQKKSRKNIKKISGEQKEHTEAVLQEKMSEKAERKTPVSIQKKDQRLSGGASVKAGRKMFQRKSV